jgi:hypothetical protein
MVGDEVYKTGSTTRQRITARNEKDGKWEYTLDDGSVVAESDLSD